ncbi:hypothetical protein HJG60_008835 [Phyllostomus discolor]|uniref:Uncharacterized protein n=1 Tax=Phyllostomus discolor TaxID=89673 RepID=A0A833YMB0_9CHIR|nr:hypothetical protein HJG60_008835 [Phyllostomus discolor]
MSGTDARREGTQRTWGRWLGTDSLTPTLRGAHTSVSDFRLPEQWEDKCPEILVAGAALKWERSDPGEHVWGRRVESGTRKAGQASPAPAAPRPRCLRADWTLVMSVGTPGLHLSTDTGLGELCDEPDAAAPSACVSGRRMRPLEEEEE